MHSKALGNMTVCYVLSATYSCHGWLVYG